MRELSIPVIIVFILTFLLFMFGCQETPVEVVEAELEEEAETVTETETEIEEIFGEEPEIKVTEDGVKYIVDPKKILGGGPPKDGIPSIDNPDFTSVEEADKWIEDDELVLAIIYRGVKRVYPHKIMVWHEIVNDTIAGDPILITYCPLCGSGIAYESRINGQAVEFGTSGKLYNSNLLMYDRMTDSYWTQITGRAIVGELSGTLLTPISIDTVVWEDWKNAHPDSEVLSRNTGFARNYDRDPYGDYYENTSIWFPIEKSDDRLHPKTFILGIEVNGVHKAYQDKDLRELKVIEDTVGGVRIRLEKDDAGIVKVINLDTGEEIVKEGDFWFAWAAFHPDTELY